MELPSMDAMESGSETASADDAEDDMEINWPPCTRAGGKEGDYENHQKLFYSQVINTLDDMEAVYPMQEGDYMEEGFEWQKA